MLSNADKQKDENTHLTCDTGQSKLVVEVVDDMKMLVLVPSHCHCKHVVLNSSPFVSQQVYDSFFY